MKSLIKDTPSMTSREIAELTGKRHDHVLRDIRNMIKELYPDQPIDFKDNPNLGYFKKQGITVDICPQTKRVTQYRLDEDHTMTLVTGYSAQLRILVYREFRRLRSIVDNWKLERTSSKFVRHQTTDVIEKFVEYATAQGSKSAKMYYINITKQVNNRLGIGSGARDTLSVDDLRLLQIVEMTAQKALEDGMQRKLFYREIFVYLKDRLEEIVKAYAATQPQIGVTQ